MTATIDPVDIGGKLLGYQPIRGLQILLNFENRTISKGDAANFVNWSWFIPFHLKAVLFRDRSLIMTSSSSSYYKIIISLNAWESRWEP